MTEQDAHPREWNAAVYQRVSNPHVGWGTKVLDRLQLNGAETAVDAGCGTGRVTAGLLDRLPAGRVIAVDQSANMLNQARANLEPIYGERVSFVQADLQTIRPADIGGEVDLVFSTATFHWIPDHDQLFRSLFQLLRPGGRLIAQCGGGPNLARVVRRAEALMASEDYASYFGDWSVPKFYADETGTARRLAEAGFVDVSTSLEEAPTILPDAATFHDYLTSVIFRAHVARLPDAGLRSSFIDELVEQAEHDTPPFSLDYWRLNMAGCRPD